MKNVNLTKDQLAKAFEDIKKACLRQVLNESGKPDRINGIQILRYYFNKSDPLIDINTPIPHCGGWTPLFFTTWLGHAEETSELLLLGASLDSTIGEEGVKPIHFAAATGKSNIIQNFLNNGTNVDSQSKSLITPLMHAAEGGHFDAVQVLMGSNPNIKLKDIHQEDCLIYASRGNNSNIAKYIQYKYMSKNLDNINKYSKSSKI